MKHISILLSYHSSADIIRSVLSSKHLDRTNAVIQLEAQRGSETIACSRDEDDDDDSVDDDDDDDDTVMLKMMRMMMMILMCIVMMTL